MSIGDDADNLNTIGVNLSMLTMMMMTMMILLISESIDIRFRIKQRWMVTVSLLVVLRLFTHQRSIVTNVICPQHKQMKY